MLKYWIWLATRKGFDGRKAGAVIRFFSSPEQAYYASEKQCRELPEYLSAPLMDKDLSVPEKILRTCYEKGIRIITMQDAAYPKRLLATEDAPVVLYCRGALQDLNRPAVGVIGTRKASVYGLTQAKKFGYGLARGGCVVVSGGALGADAEAMRGALLGGGPVVGVLGCGIDVDYPKANRQLFRDVEQNGCLISEFPPGTGAYPQNFPIRNRIISGLSLGVLVVEAPERSGALITASRALDQGRDVFVLPANVGVASYAGNLKLLRDGAIAVGSAWDVLQEYAALYPQLHRESCDQMPEEEQQQAPVPAQPEKKVVDKPKPKAYIDIAEIKDTLDSAERSLVELLAEGPVHIDILVERTGMTAAAALASLTVLEVKGVVVRPSASMYELTKK